MFDFWKSEDNAITDKLVFVIWPSGRKKEQKPHNKGDAWNVVWMRADVHYNISSGFARTHRCSDLFNRNNTGFPSCILKVTLLKWIKSCSAQFSYQTRIRGWTMSETCWCGSLVRKTLTAATMATTEWQSHDENSTHCERQHHPNVHNYWWEYVKRFINPGQ